MKSRFFHTIPNHCHKSRPIRLTGLNYDHRAAYVESVCTLLNESRFGLASSIPAGLHVYRNKSTQRPVRPRPGSNVPLSLRSYKHSTPPASFCPADEPVSLLDLIEQECVSWFEMDCRQNRLRQRAANTMAGHNLAEKTDRRTRVQHPLGRAPTPSYFPWALGRGSP